MFPVSIFSKSSGNSSLPCNFFSSRCVVNFVAKRANEEREFAVGALRLGTERFEYRTYACLLPGDVLDLKLVSGSQTFEAKGVVVTASEPGVTCQTGIILFRETTPRHQEIIGSIIQRLKTCIA